MHAMTAKQAARYLNISVGTVKTHSNKIYKQLGVKNRVEAIVALSARPQSVSNGGPLRASRFSFGALAVTRADASMHLPYSEACELTRNLATLYPEALK